LITVYHTPVLFDKSLEFLVTDVNGIYFDGTLGFGGHSSGILNRLGPDGLLISTDVDQDAFSFSKKKFSEDKRIKIYNLNFSQIDIIAKIESIQFFNGIFLDLGVSSFQLDNAESGFSYRNNAQLDLRMDKSRVINAADVVNSYSEEDLANIIFQYGEEKNSRKIAKVICEIRREKKIQTTLDLSNIITEITPQRYHTKTLSRVFQALRIYVNDELNTLKLVLKKSIERVMTNREAKGIRMEVSGRLNGIEIARREWLGSGRMPRNTIRADIDYALDESQFTYGKIGIKIWVYKGYKFD